MTKFCNQLSVCHLTTEFPFHESYKKWVEAKYHRYVIPLPEKQNMVLDDSDSSDSE